MSKKYQRGRSGWVCCCHVWEARLHRSNILIHIQLFIFADIFRLCLSELCFGHNNQRDDDNQKQTDVVFVVALVTKAGTVKASPSFQKAAAHLLWICYFWSSYCSSLLFISQWPGPKTQRCKDVEVVIDLILQRWPFVALWRYNVTKRKQVDSWSWFQ